MNEERIKSNLNLIDKLLECPSDCFKILKDHFSLVDEDFVAMLTQIVVVLERENEHDAANFLNCVAHHIAEVMEYNFLLAEQGPFQPQVTFLSQLLQVAYESNVSSHKIYPLLEANLDKLDDNFAQILSNWTIQTLSTLEGTEALNIAILIGDLCIQLAEFPKGNQACNLEIAIKGTEALLKSNFTYDNHPQGWALIQSALGNFYGKRIRGDRTDNLEKAIACHENTLQVWTYENCPDSWVLSNNNLANTYIQRIKGEVAENIEQAIQYCRNALKVNTYELFPEYWADTQIHLGTAYSYRILGDRAENLERSIICYQNTLNIYIYDTFPKGWASAQNHLGAAYFCRVYEQQSENLEKSISCYKEALKVHTLEDLPYLWAETQNNLGEAYRIRVQGEWIENFLQAIADYEGALEVWTFDAFPEQWAMVQTNLGEAYRTSRAITPVENFEKAISYYENALRVYSREVFPERWATIQNNLGSAYAERIEGNKEKNLKQAIMYFKSALQVHTKEAFPRYYAETLENLGRVYQNAKKFEDSYSTFVSAIETVELLRDEIISGVDIKQKLAQDWHLLYQNIVKVSLELGNQIKAIEYVERSKTRNLVELILNRDSKIIFPQEVVTQLEQLQEKINVGQYQLQNCTTENSSTLAQHLQQLRKKRNEIQDEYLPVGYGFNFDKFQTYLDKQIVIIEWYFTGTILETFIITCDSLKRLNISQTNENYDILLNWIDKYLNTYRNNKTEWRNTLASCLTSLAEILQIEEILKLIPKNCTRLILVPHRYLHIFPLHTLPLNNGKLLYEKFIDGVSYAPSCQILQQVQQRKRPDFQNLFAIQNPTSDLNYTNLEVQVIQTYFNTANILKKSAATLTAINDSDLNIYHCAHFSCHGYFNLANPSKSALILANAPITDRPTNLDSERYFKLRAGETHDLEKCLTLDKIFTLKLEKCRLVTLSACETGLIDFNNISDEYIGLPSGFLLAGGQAVVSSLWTVDDLSTSFMMIKFYENFQIINNVSLALNQAQHWLRNLTTEEFEALLVKYQSQIEENFAQLPEEKRPVAKAILKRTCKRKPHPFAAPFYWAGFIATGI
jgi:CHAT domain-containing protein